MPQRRPRGHRGAEAGGEGPRVPAADGGSASGRRSCEMHITELGLVAKDEGRRGFKQGPDTATFVF